MDFLDYLAKTLETTDDDEIEIGFSEESTLERVLNEPQSNQA